MDFDYMENNEQSRQTSLLGVIALARALSSNTSDEQQITESSYKEAEKIPETDFSLPDPWNDRLTNYSEDIHTFPVDCVINHSSKESESDFASPDQRNVRLTNDLDNLCNNLSRLRNHETFLADYTSNDSPKECESEHSNKSNCEEDDLALRLLACNHITERHTRSCRGSSNDSSNDTDCIDLSSIDWLMDSKLASTPLELWSHNGLPMAVTDTFESVSFNHNITDTDFSVRESQFQYSDENYVGNEQRALGLLAGQTFNRSDNYKNSFGLADESDWSNISYIDWNKDRKVCSTPMASF